MEKIEKKEKKRDWCFWLGWGVAAFTSIIALKQKERADKFEGQLINLDRINRGQQRTINILNYELGRVAETKK